MTDKAYEALSELAELRNAEPTDSVFNATGMVSGTHFARLRRLAGLGLCVSTIFGMRACQSLFEMGLTPIEIQSILVIAHMDMLQRYSHASVDNSVLSWKECEMRQVSMFDSAPVNHAIMDFTEREAERMWAR